MGLNPNFLIAQGAEVDQCRIVRHLIYDNDPRGQSGQRDSRSKPVTDVHHGWHSAARTRTDATDGGC